MNIHHRSLNVFGNIEKTKSISRLSYRPRSFNILGNIAVINFSNEFPKEDKKTFAQELLKKHPNIKTILEKSGKFSGRLRKMKTKYLAGEKNKEVLYKENNCVFRFNIDGTYFSPRLSNERKEIASMIKKNDKVLVMFAGVGPFSIVIAKNSRAKKIFSNEINREANKYADLNIKLNKVGDKISIIPGDIKKVAQQLFYQRLLKPLPRNSVVQMVPSKFNVIVMPRPRLKESFLKQAFMLSKKGTKIFYYDFCKSGEENKILEKIKNEAKKAGKKIKILKIKQAGEIAPYKIRVRVDFKIV
ncbi:hypothetical protein HYS72_00270 [Candidatus Pacearchaeota archaeon]|nr:hypothetical protein [Candidatus Pacearchaeota archaeon]MBI2056856.1 hypothetical protein [Candidatus Pacearchaeota archaeon]